MRARLPLRVVHTAGTRRRFSLALQRLVCAGHDYVPHTVVANAHRDHASRPVWFNPCDVSRVLPRASRHAVPTTFVMRGFQDAVLRTWLDGHDLHPTVRELWVEGRHFTRTTQYAVMIKAVEAFQRGQCAHPERLGAYWCRTAEDVDHYFEILNNAFESIRDGGYRLQCDLRAPIGSRNVASCASLETTSASSSRAMAASP